jgi:hypothetical protein
MQHFARSLISPLAISLCVLCVFMVRLRNPDSNQHRAKRGFLAKAPNSQWTGANKLHRNTLAEFAQVRFLRR